MTHHMLLEEIKKLEPKARLELIDEIYDTLDDNDAAFDLTDAQKAELERRFAYLKEHPDATIPLEELKIKMKNRSAKK